MAIKEIKETFSNLKRLRFVVQVLHQHGFDAELWRLGLDRWLGLAIPQKFSDNDGTRKGVSAAERLVAALEELGATYIKFGQVLATRSDLLPPEYIKAFSRLQDKVVPVPYSAMREVLAAALPFPAEEIFADFNQLAVASGSIGQVYFATLHNGSDVVVKVKRPGTDERMQEDLSLLRFLAGIIERKLPEIMVISPVTLVDEFSRSLQNELNFLTEAAYTEKFHQLFNRDGKSNSAEDTPRVRIPRVYWEYSGTDVLVEERLRGKSLTEFCDDLAAGRESRVTAAAIADTLTKCFLEQYFIQGFFHSDPHPGNLLVMDGRTLGIIDFGQVGQLGQEMQRNFVGLLVALGRGDIDAAVDILCTIVVTGEDCDLRDFRNDFGMLLNRVYGVPFNRLRLGEAINEGIVVARRYGIALPRDLVLLVKSLVTLQGIVMRLAPASRLNEAVWPFIRRVMKDWVKPKKIAWDGAFFLFQMLGILKRFPENMRTLLYKVNNGKIRVNIHHDELEELGNQVEKASNRLTLGMLIAAILLGSSIILAGASEAVNRIYMPLFDQIPLSAVIAGMGYLAALGLGVWLAWAILRGKRL